MPPHSQETSVVASRDTSQRWPLTNRGVLQLGFDIDTLSIPDVSYDTARILGLPLPPIFRIAIQPLSLQVLPCNYTVTAVPAG